MLFSFSEFIITNFDQLSNSPLTLHPIDVYIQQPTYRLALHHIASSFWHRSCFIFYINGLVQHLNQQTFASMTWYEVFTTIHKEFSCSVTTNFIFSTKAKLVAVIVTLITVPTRASVSIYTDSQNLLTTYQQLSVSDTLQYSRECLKFTYIDLWHILFQLIKFNSFTFTIHKIKAYANNIYNNYVDQLSKECVTQEPIQFTTFTGLFNVILQILNYPISTNCRRLIKESTRIKDFFDFFFLKWNAKYRQLNIDWINTFNYLNSDASFYITSLRVSSKKAQQIKFLLEELPTLEHL